MINWNKVSQRVFGIIRGAGHQLEMYDLEGNIVSDPIKARRFFVAKPNYMITVDEDQRTVRINRNMNTELKAVNDVFRMIRNLRREFAVKVGIRVFGKAIKPKDVAYQADIQKQRKAEDMLESNMYGRQKTSYQHFDNGVTLIVKHSASVDPERPGSRSRNISKMFVKCQNQRHCLPFCDLGAGRALAQHCAHGGTPDDQVSAHIADLANQCHTLRDFVRYNRSKQNTHSHEAQRAARNHVKSLRQCLRQASTKSGIQRFQDLVQSGESPLASHNTAPEELTHSYVQQHMDPRAEAALPLLSDLIDQQRERLLKASNQPVYLVPTDVTEADIMQYPEPHKNFSHRMKRLINSMQPGELRDHLDEIAGRIERQQPISEFDQRLVKNTLKNIKKH